jgi:hypothetical protein
MLRVDLRDGRVMRRVLAPEGVAFDEIDWIQPPAP